MMMHRPPGGFWPLMGVFLFSLLMSAGARSAPPYANDPEVVAAIRGVPSGHSLLLPPVHVDMGEYVNAELEKFGPGQRDYCNKMPYAPTRETALYAGGNHQVPHRMNDVWEYHLGSNAWHLLYAPDGGNAGAHKSAYFLTSRNLVRDPQMTLSEKQRLEIARYKTWWEEQVEFAEGHLASRRGGPIMPSHTWDAFCFEEVSGRLLWGMGASPAAQLSTQAYFTGHPLAEWEAKADPAYTPMWMFDPALKRWTQYRTSRPHAELRGMGATMTYLPDLQKCIWYVAAQNVSPHAFEMWMFDTPTDTWTELKPNGGRSIDELAIKERCAPMAEAQAVYAAPHRKLYALLKNDTFVYDVAANSWEKICTDARIFAHDAHSVLGYDPRSDALLLAFAPAGKGKELQLASFSLKSNAWTLHQPEGDGLVPPTKYGGTMGYFDPLYGVFVLQGRYSNRIWIYRP